MSSDLCKRIYSLSIEQKRYLFKNTADQDTVQYNSTTPITCLISRVLLIKKKRDKLKADIYDTAVVLPQTLKMEEELGIVTRAAREMYELHFPGEGSLGADR